jgi:hypothetical protein
MTRAEIEAEFTVQFGVITSPGKFEMEPVWSPYYWDLALNGDGDTDTVHAIEVTHFDVQTDDVDQFPELTNFERVSVWEDEAGFVHTNTE